MSQSLDESQAAAAPRFTQTQGQYLAFIYAYSRIFKRPPAEADMRRHFEVTAPTVHQMVLTCEKPGFSHRWPEAPGAFNFWSLQKPSQSCDNPTGRNLCGELLDAFEMLDVQASNFAKLRAKVMEREAGYGWRAQSR